MQPPAQDTTTDGGGKRAKVAALSAGRNEKHNKSVSQPDVFRRRESRVADRFNPYPTAFPYGNGMVLHFYQQQESSTTKTVHKVINKGLKTYV